MLRLIRELLNFEPQRHRTDIAQALDYLGRVTHRRAVVFLVSDFFAEGYEKPLRIVARRHDLIAVSLNDPREQSLPPVGLVELEDAETGETIVLDAGNAEVRKRWEAIAREREDGLAELFRASGVDAIRIVTGRDYVRDLTAFFRRREKKL